MAVNDVTPNGPYALCMALAERHILQSALDSFAGDVEIAAASLRITESFFRNRAETLGMEVAAPVPVIEPSADQTPTVELKPAPSIAEPDTARRVIALPVGTKRPVALAVPRAAESAPAAEAPNRELSVHEREALAASLLEKDLLEEDDD